MSTTVPRRRVITNATVNPEDFEDGVRPFEEALGALNEHNFDAPALANSDIDGEYEFGTFCNSSLSSSDFDVERLAAAYIGPFHITSTYEAISGGITFIEAQSQKVTDARQWVDLDGSSQTKTMDSGRLCIQWSGQAASYLWNAGVRCFKFGVFLDGALVSESVIGGLDLGAEPANMDQGPGWNLVPFDGEITVPVSKGTHTAKVAAWVEPLEGENLNSATAVVGLYVFWAETHLLLRAR